MCFLWYDWHSILSLSDILVTRRRLIEEEKTDKKIFIKSLNFNCPELSIFLHYMSFLFFLNFAIKYEQKHSFNNSNDHATYYYKCNVVNVFRLLSLSGSWLTSGVYILPNGSFYYEPQGSLYSCNLPHS